MYKINYFEIFGIKPELEINLKDLKNKYYELQKLYHPDKIDNSDIEKSILLNEGYKILNDEILRIIHLLELKNIHINDETKPSMDVLMLAMEQRERLESVSNIEDLKRIAKDIDDEIAKLRLQFKSSYDADDMMQSSQIAISMQYMHKIKMDIKQKIQKLLS